jgi:hypothetical protein
LRDGKWENSLAKIQEYGIEIRPLKAVKGQGLCKLVAGTNSLNGVISISTISYSSTSEWYKDIIFYLKYGQFPNGMYSKERRALKMKENQYVLVVEIHF